MAFARQGFWRQWLSDILVQYSAIKFCVLVLIFFSGQKLSPSSFVYPDFSLLLVNITVSFLSRFFMSFS